MSDEAARAVATHPPTGVVVWLVGLPASGKSTLARDVAARLLERGERAVLLDGDEVRALLRPPPGYDEAARDAFYETLAGLASLASRQGHVVLVPATAHLRRFRERARALAPRFVEVLCDTGVEECARRDPKGLYAAALGDPSRSTLPGVGAPFERPERADVVVVPGEPGAAERVLAALATARAA